MRSSSVLWKKTSIQYNQHDPCFTVLFLKGSTFGLLLKKNVFELLYMPRYLWELALNKWRLSGETNINWKKCWVTRVNNKATWWLLEIVNHNILYGKDAHVNHILKLNTVPISCKVGGQEINFPLKTRDIWSLALQWTRLFQPQERQISVLWNIFSEKKLFTRSLSQQKWGCSKEDGSVSPNFLFSA